MPIDTPIAYYLKRGFKGFWPRININPNSELPQYPKLSEEAEGILEDYLIRLSHTRKRCFVFHIFIEPVVDYSRQAEYFSRTNFLSTTFSCHIEYDIFRKADKIQKLSLILTACQLLFDYWSSDSVLPTDINVSEFSINIKEYLLSKGLYNFDKSFFYKPITNTNFHILVVSGPHANINKLSYNIINLEKFLTNSLIEKTFGRSIRNFSFGFHLFKFGGMASDYFDGSDNLIKYSSKYRSLYVSRQFNYDEILKINKTKQWLDFKTKMKEALSLIREYKKLPKDFDVLDFTQFVANKLEQYEIN